MRQRSSSFSIVIATLAAATSIGEAAALIDASDSFDPQLAETDGVDLRRLLWVRPHTMKDTVTAAEMIGATGFQLVIIDMADDHDRIALINANLREFDYENHGWRATFHPVSQQPNDDALTQLSD